MNIKNHRIAFFVATAAALLVGASGALANHSWGNYHWARTSNPFTLKLGDNVSSAWDPYLATTSGDWSLSSALDTTIVAGNTKPRACKATSGRVEVCNASYGYTGWLGIATIWASGDHITQGTVKVNDTYFNSSLYNYNTPPWRNLVMCQEVGHTLGLAHQDENNSNPNLGSCMDYTSDPDGPPSNEHPNQHDYDQLEAIYAHLDTINTVKSKVLGAGQKIGEDEEEHPGFGTVEKRDSHNRPSRFVKENHQTGETVTTFVIWAD